MQSEGRRAGTGRWLPVCLMTMVLLALAPASPIQAGSSPAQAGKRVLTDPAVIDWLVQLSRRTGIPDDWLVAQMLEVDWNQKVLDLIARPAEKTLGWPEYSGIFLKAGRIEAGRQFLQRHQELLQRAQGRYGVPASVIAAIIGVESYYGRIQGKHGILSALTTLGFRYPRRSKFFRQELGEFLALAYEEGWPAASRQGSYAGAMGLPQFIASSYRAYAVDFDGDGKRDLLNSPADAIGSVANYLRRHGWRTGEPVARRVKPADDGPDAAWRRLSGDGLKPELTDQQLRAHGIAQPLDVPGRRSLYGFDTNPGTEVWIGYHNLYVITRYNHSEMYALVVHRLSELLTTDG